MSVLNTPVVTASYSDSFWDDQYKGCDILSTRLRKSKETSEEIKRLYQARAEIEQEYGDKLLKLSQNTNLSQNEESSFAETLTHISSTLETTARAHIDLAQKFKDHLEVPLEGFIKEQREIRKAQQQQVESTKQLRNLHENDVTRANVDYANECSKIILLEEHFEREGNNNIELSREIEEQRRRVSIAEQVYRRSVDSLNSVNEKWISDWKTATSVFQDLEVSRMNYLQSTFNTFSKLMKNTFGNDEDCCDQINTYLGITDVNQDMIEFVKHHGTGTKLPAHVSYEILYTPPPQPKAQPFVNTNIQPIPPMALQHEESPVTTVLTNPDEELKSVDQQLQILEHTLPEQLSSPTNDDHYAGSREISHNEADQVPVKSYADASNVEPPKVELAPLTPPLLGTDKTGSSNISLNELDKDRSRYQPKPNPSFNSTDMNNQTEPTLPSVIVNARTSSLNSPTNNPAKRHTLVMENYGDEEVDNPRPTPPKDEKWMISSIRRPRQMPVNSRHTKVIDSNSINSRTSLPQSLSDNENQQDNEDITPPSSGIQQYQPKMQRPGTPLNIDIPNENRMSDANVQTLAHQVIAQGKRQSSQQQQNTENQRNMIRNSFVNNNQDESYRSTYKPRDSSLMLNPQEQNHHYYNDENDQKKRTSSTQLPILNKLMSPTSEKHQKEKTGRFSIPFFNGKKDKKKDKEHIQQQQQQQLSPTFNDKRMSNYQQHPDNMYHINQPQQQQQRQYHQPQPPRYQQMQLQPKQQQKEDIPELIAANRSSTQLANDQPQKTPTEQKEYVGYARAMWSFEATIPEEMTFQQGDIIGIIHKQGDGWWVAELIKSQKPTQHGLVPGNYMTDLQQ